MSNDYLEHERVYLFADVKLAQNFAVLGGFQEQVQQGQSVL